MAFVDRVLTTKLAMVPDAFVIPLGLRVSTLVRAEADRGALIPERCLFDFPHPSGANCHRVRSTRSNATPWPPT
jgi:hypothetical protein